MKRLHPLGWLLLGLALAGVSASLAQVYGFFPPPGMTYTQQSATTGALSINESLSVIGPATPFPGPNIALSTTARSGTVGTYFGINTQGAPFVAITENVNSNAAFTVCTPGGPGGISQPNLTGSCEFLGTDGSQGVHTLSSSFDQVFMDVRSINSTANESPTYYLENAAGKFFGVGQLTSNIATGNCLDANGPAAPCAILGSPPDPYPVCIGNFVSFVAWGCFNWNAANLALQLVHNNNSTSHNWASGTVISATQLNSTFGDNSQAASVTSVVGGTPANTQANGLPIATTIRVTSASIGGGALAAGACASTTTTVTGATTAMMAQSSPTTDPGVGFYWQSLVSAANSVVTRVCATVAGTPTASTYIVRVFL